MKINNNDIPKYLKYIFNKYNFNNQTQDTINNLINTNDAHNKIKINKYNNIQIEGSDSNSLKNELKQVKVNQDVYYDILKYDRLYYSIPIYNMSNYVIRIYELNLKINTPILNCLKNMYDDFLPFYKQNVSKINFKKIIIIKNKNHTLNKFNNINSNLFFIKLCIIYILFFISKK